MARRLAKPVHVTDGEGRSHRLQAGSVPAPELAALIRNPHAWEGGTVPTADEVAAPDAPVQVVTRVIVSPIPGDRAAYEDLSREDLDAICAARGVTPPADMSDANVVEGLLDLDAVLWSELEQLSPPAAPATPSPAGDPDDEPTGDKPPAKAAPKKTTPDKNPTS